MDTIFIDKQIRFMYGRFYDELIDKAILFIDKESICENIGNKNWNRGQYNISIANILSNKTDSENLGSTNKHNFPFLCEVICRYWPSAKPSENYVMRFNFHDYMKFNEFILTHNRPYKSQNQVLFPLNRYMSPSVVKIDDAIPFRHKQPILFWRGSTTGRHLPSINIRYNVIVKNFNVHSNIDIGFSDFVLQIYKDNKELLDKYYKKGIDKSQQLNFKFILNLEGNDWASSFPWVLASNCCPLHNYPFSFESWFFGQGLEPYVHFVPVKNDGSDLLSQYEWCMNNLDKCEEIAKAGKAYMEPYLDEHVFNKTLQRFVELYPLKIKA